MTTDTDIDTADEDEPVCPACEGDNADEAHICDWVNEECPSGCSMEHDEPERDSIFVCPQTDVYWRYCDRCGWEEVNLYAGDPFYIYGELLCDPSEHGYDVCDGCGEWHDQDNMTFSEYDDCYYCDVCYQDLGAGRGRCDGARRTYCSRCETYNIHLNLWTEEYLCDCHALAAHAGGIPVRFRDDWSDGPVRRLIAGMANLAGLTVAA